MTKRARPFSATRRVAGATARSFVRPRANAAPTAIERTIPSADAAEWMAHWHAAAELREWPGGGLTDLEADQNVGTMSVFLASGANASAIRCDWRRARGGDLNLRIGPADTRPPAASRIAEFVAQIDARLRNRVRESGFRRGWLTYDGLPWRGELWLTDSLRLGPPSRIPHAHVGRQAVIVDSEVQGIGQRGLFDTFARVRRELSLVLSPILDATLTDGMNADQDWVADSDAEQGWIDSRLRTVGYIELDTAHDLPRQGTAPALPLIPKDLLEHGPYGSSSVDSCIRVPDDVVSLWQQFQHLGPDRHMQFMRACNAYSIARSMFPHQRTAYATFLVVACEALKPPGNRARDANLYDVIATLLDTATAAQLQTLRHPPQKVRSAQVHRGELRSNELARDLEMDAFADPSFDEMLNQLSRITRQCLMEWLRRGGIDALVWMPRPVGTKIKGPPRTKSGRKPGPRR